jgi:hypothetical protein
MNAKIRITGSVLGLVTLLVVSACASGNLPAAPPPATLDSQAAKYCTDNGGVVQTRYPAYGTNNLASATRLSGQRRFCQFTSASDGSRIHIALDTLYSTEPTLAVLAYLSKPPLATDTTPGVNPSSLYCSQLGGTDLFGGVNAAGGGWVTDDTTTPDTVLQACIFPYLSTIDSWGLTYHSDGTIRGADLGTLVRYRPEEAPRVFP